MDTTLKVRWKLNDALFLLKCELRGFPHERHSTIYVVN